MDNKKRVVIIISKCDLKFINSYISYKYVDTQTIRNILINFDCLFSAFDNVGWVEKVSYIDAIQFEQSSKDYMYSVHLDLDTNNLYVYDCGWINYIECL